MPISLKRHEFELEALGQRVEGSIASISAGKLVIAVREDLGAELRHAVLLIDATALLEALATKIDEVKNGQITLNRELADAVAGRRPAPVGASEIRSTTTPSLNTAQRKAYDRARTTS